VMDEVVAQYAPQAAASDLALLVMRDLMRLSDGSAANR